jgi:hypothetical protein
MPTERRRIIFSDDEIVSAAISHCRSTGIALPDAEVEDLDIAMDGDCSLCLTFAVTSPEQVDELTLDPETLLSALIAFCRNRAIPIPRSASKRLEPMEGSLSMVFNMRRARGSVRKSAANGQTVLVF